jgi:hypothetical protein
MSMSVLFNAVILATLLLSSSDPPDIAGNWAGEDWGDVVLKQTNPGEYSGTYTEIGGPKSGEIKLKWSPVESRFNGTWSEGQERFGDLSIRLIDNEIRGAYTNLLKSKANPGGPGLGDLRWCSGQGKLARPIDLKAAYHTSIDRAARNKTFPWRAVPQGMKKLGNVPINIGGLISLWGEANAKNGMKFPEQSRDIAVDRKFDCLYVYHAAFFHSPEGSPIYDLTMQYADGTSSTTNMFYGTHLRDWYQWLDEGDVPMGDSNSKMVWRGEHPGSSPQRPLQLRFFITAIPNPKPDLEVKLIKLNSAKGNSAGCILALTTGPAGLLKVAPEDIAPAIASEP